MNKRLIQTVMILLLISQVLLNFVPSYVVKGAWIIEGDKVYIDDEYVYLSAEPHTIIETADVVFELISKQFGGEIDVAFGINNTNMNVKNPRLWNGTAWNPLTINIQVVNQTYQGYNKWYLLKNVNINQNVLYRLKLTVDVVFNTSGKYFFGVKKSIDPISAGYYLDPWWDGNWNYFTPLTVASSYIDNPLVDFPLLVVINSTLGAKCNSGDSIRFLSTDNITEFNYEIEKWDGAGNSYVWVNISETITNISDYTFLMYYGNTGASDNQNPTGVWNSSYLAVYHMDNDTASNVTDSTSNYKNSTEVYGNPTYQQTGASGYAVDFDNVDDGFRLPNASIANTDDFTIFMVAKADTHVHDAILTLNHGTKVFNEYFDSNTALSFRWDSGVWRASNYKSNPSVGVWRYLTVSYDVDGIASLYVNGSYITGNVNTGNMDINTVSNTIGCVYDGVDSIREWDGLIDEVRISSIVRNASWIKASYHSIKQTAGFLSWGYEVSNLGLESPTGFTANTTSNSVIFLNWTKATNATHTHIMKKTGSYPSTIIDGTNIYNGSLENYSDTSLPRMIVYYYSAWSFNSTTGNWSGKVTATNHTGPANPTSVNAGVGAGYLNITWIAGTRADTTLLLHKADSHPSSESDGALLYDGTNLYYNDTVHHSGYYALFSWSNVTNLYSTGYDVQYGSLTIFVYDESNGTAITGWDCFVTNQNGSETYESLGNNNPLVIDIDDLPLGDNVAIKLNATNYNFSLFYMNLVANNQYTLNAHLTHRDVSLLCLLTVWDEIDLPIEDATMEIKRYINASVGFEYVGIYITDANGQVTTYLTPNELYKFIITKTDYETEIADWIPDVEIREKTFRLIHVAGEDEEFYIFWDYIKFTGVMNDDGNITILYIDSSLLTANTQIYLYDSYAGTDTLINTAGYTGINSFSYMVNGCNNSRLHYAKLYFNHSYDFSITQPVTVYIQPTNKTNASFEPHTVTDLEGAFTNTLGKNPLGWGNSISFAVAFIILCSFAPYDVGAAIIGSGLGLIGVQSAFVINPVLIITVPIIIAIGIFYILAKRQAEEMV